MCMIHQIRIVKNDLKYLKPSGDVLEFLTTLKGMLQELHDAHEIIDDKERVAKADLIDAKLTELMDRQYEDDRHDTIKRYRKRYRRELEFMTTFLRMEGVLPDSNGVERKVRYIMPVKKNGGGNRSQKGMDANSVLLTIMATDHITGSSFFEHVVRSSSGDG